MIAAVLNHLWQSTMFALCVGLLSLTLRANSARFRYWLWFSASVKFLVPLYAVAAIASLVPHIHDADPAPAVAAVQQILAPLTANAAASAGASDLSAPVASAPALTPILWALWGLGFVAVVAVWLYRWSRIRAALRGATDLSIQSPIPAKSSASLIEPGVVGVWKPILVLPDGIKDRLTAAEIRAVFAHELCHLRNRDNLTAAIHMLVSALFWFHPLVWWLGGRLIEERERACDEDVVAAGNEPTIYAGAILKVCRLYLKSPLACAAGVSGANLNKRIRRIMMNSETARLGWAKKLLVVSAAIVGLGVPLAFEVIDAAPAAAQTPKESAADFAPDRVAQRRADQAAPRKAIALDPKAFDKYAGYYQLNTSVIAKVWRDGPLFFSQLTGQQPVEFFAESGSKFFATVVPAQISFTTDAHGAVTELVLHQNGLEQHAPRITEAAANSIESALARRIKANMPSPGTEAALRKTIAALAGGRPNYDEMSLALAAATRDQLPMIEQDLQRWGALKAITFKNVNPGGVDVYVVDFQNGKVQWNVAPLRPDGKLGGLFFRELS